MNTYRLASGERPSQVVAFWGQWGKNFGGLESLAPFDFVYS